MKSLKMSEFFWLEVLFGIAGGLIGFGSDGTLQSACYGAGIGLIAIPAILLFLLILVGL